MWCVHIVFKGWKVVDPAAQREIKPGRQRQDKRRKQNEVNTWKGFFLSLWASFTMMTHWHTWWLLLQYFVKGFRLVRNFTVLGDIKHSASLWSGPGAKSWALCFCSLVHHILLEESSLLQTLSFLFHKGKRSVDGNNHFYWQNAKRNYILLLDKSAGIFDLCA